MAFIGPSSARRWNGRYGEVPRSWRVAVIGPACDAERSMSAPVVGRERELAAIERLLAGLATGPRALVLEGAPGIGKTTVWLRALAAPGIPVLSCRPVEAEAKLAFASLADLL